MIENFVSDETSKDFKEFGFYKPCFAIKLGENIFYGEFSNDHEEYDNGLILWQQAIDWFEENDVYVSTFKAIGKWHWKVDVDENYKDFSREHGFDTKYEALSVALKIALKLLDEID